MAYGQFEQFIRNLGRVMQIVNTKLQRDLTMRSRVSRRFSMIEVTEFLAADVTYLTGIGKDLPAFPEGERNGRERSFSPSEIKQIRGIMASRPSERREHLYWRQADDPVKVITFGAQKGGTGKSLTAAHIAQYLSLFYGLWVGIIDADPQATTSLYFADADLPLFSPETATLAEFMGIDDLGSTALTPRTPEELNAIWQPTPWPGTRLIPGGANIQNGDIILFFLSKSARVPVYRVLRDAIGAWAAANRPVSVPPICATARGPLTPQNLTPLSTKHTMWW